LHESEAPVAAPKRVRVGGCTPACPLGRHTRAHRRQRRRRRHHPHPRRGTATAPACAPPVAISTAATARAAGLAPPSRRTAGTAGAKAASQTRRRPWQLHAAPTPPVNGQTRSRDRAGAAAPSNSRNGGGQGSVTDASPTIAAPRRACAPGGGENAQPPDDTLRRGPARRPLAATAVRPGELHGAPAASSRHVFTPAAIRAAGGDRRGVGVGVTRGSASMGPQRKATQRVRTVRKSAEKGAASQGCMMQLGGEHEKLDNQARRGDQQGI